jgi:ATP-dependent DNA helicase RecG
MLQVLTADDRVTLAGLLCFGRFPQHWFPSLAITFVHYPGNQPDQLGPGGERFLDDRRFDGPLPAALDDALNTIVRSMKKRSLIQGLLRQEIPEYPPEAVREALVNAVAHRDYSPLARGSQVQVQMYQSRLEIRNPGGLFGPVNEDNLGEPGVQATRNQHLIQLLEDLGPAENRGTGIITMMRAMRQAQMSPPELEDHRTHFRVVFSNTTMLDDATVEWLNRFSSLGLNENQRLALAYTLHQKEITNSIFCRLTGTDSRAATAELQELVLKGLLQSLGSRRWTTYRLSQQVLDLAGERALPPKDRATLSDRQKRILEMIAERGPVSAKAISDALTIPRRAVNYELSKLTVAGLIQLTTDDPRDSRTEYRIAPPGSETGAY